MISNGKDERTGCMNWGEGGAVLIALLKCICENVPWVYDGCSRATAEYHLIRININTIIIIAYAQTFHSVRIYTEVDLCFGMPDYYVLPVPSQEIAMHLQQSGR